MCAIALGIVRCGQFGVLYLLGCHQAGREISLVSSFLHLIKMQCMPLLVIEIVWIEGLTLNHPCGQHVHPSDAGPESGLFHNWEHS